MLVPLSAQIVADDPIEERQIAKEKYSSYKRPGVEPITIVKTYVKGNIRYWEECTPSGIIVRISSRGNNSQCRSITALTGLVWF